MALRFNPPPGWPTPPQGFVPGPGWQPDPGWPAAPPGWQLWVPDDAPGNPTAAGSGAPAASAGAGEGAPRTSAEAGYWLPPGPAPTAYGQPPVSGWAVPARQPSGTSRLAVAAFVLGLLGFVVITAIVGIVFGAQALGHIRRSLQGGKTLAILGIVFGAGWLVLWAALIAIGATVGSSSPGSSPPRPGSNVPGSQPVLVTSLVTGECFDLPTPKVMNQPLVTFVEKIPCGQPHNSQVFATFPVSGSALSFPGSARLGSLAGSGCPARIKASVDSAKLTDSMGVRFLYPGQDTWLAGNHTITCIITNSTSDMRSSLLTR